MKGAAPQFSVAGGSERAFVFSPARERRDCHCVNRKKQFALLITTTTTTTTTNYYYYYYYCYYYCYYY